MEAILSNIEFAGYLIVAGVTFLGVGASFMAFLVCMAEQGRH